MYSVMFEIITERVVEGVKKYTGDKNDTKVNTKRKKPLKLAKEKCERSNLIIDKETQ